MVQGYYTLDEAAKILGVSSENLNQMAQKREVRGFQDRGTWRFRTQDIEELARRKGIGSNPDLQLGEAKKNPPSQKSDTPVRQPAGSDAGDLSDQVEIGQEIISETPSGSRKVASKGGSGSKNLGPKSPPPKPGSDSDVRLVADGSDVTFKVAPDSDVRVVQPPAPKSGIRKKAPAKEDSGVQLVGMESESDSDVKIVPDSKDDVNVIGGHPGKAGTDSDIRLEQHKDTRSPEDSFLTEEIDLDAELRAAEEAAKAKKAKKKDSSPAIPFELSESDIDSKKRMPAAGKGSPESSSEFDLSIDSGSSIELDSGDLTPKKEEEVALGEAPPRGVTGARDSGINLQAPADSGISLEQGGDSSDEIEFELSLDAESSTPKPKAAATSPDSSSEFELTLEDSARLAPLEEEGKAAKEEDKDIFETDFEVPALEDESGSQVAALDESDTDLESSDFDLALGEEDMAAEEGSGSQVVALDEEGEVDEGAATVARPRKAGEAAAEEEEAGELLEEGELEEEEEVVPRRAAMAAAAPADWGVFAPVTLLLSVLVLFFVGLMSFELLHGMWGYRQPYRVPSMVIRGAGSMMPWVEAKDLDRD